MKFGLDVDGARAMLGVGWRATTSDIETAFRKRMMKAHPDHGGTQAEAERVLEARKILLQVRPKEVKTRFASETAFVSWVQTKLRDEGAVVLKVHGHAMQQSGWPDLQVYSRVWSGHLEAKCEDNTTSTIQKIIISDLRRAGTDAWVLRWKGVATIETERGAVIEVLGEGRWLDQLAEISARCRK